MEVELVKRDEETLPKGHGLHAETWRCPSGLSLAPRSGIGVGGEAESGREAPARGESLSVHPAPTPGLLSVLAATPTSDTSVHPAKADMDSTSL